jgi:hypothetical protein
LMINGAAIWRRRSSADTTSPDWGMLVVGSVVGSRLRRR